MPMIDVRLYEGRLDEHGTSEMIRRITDAVVAVLGERTRAQTWVVIDEVPAPKWGIGGEPGTPPGKG
jgi:4-oxalocrotonate tautomerase